LWKEGTGEEAIEVEVPNGLKYYVKARSYVVYEGEKIYSPYSELFILDNSEEILIEKSYAVYSSSDNSLTFVRSNKSINVGDIYNGKIVTAVYDGSDSETGFENAIYSNRTSVPWNAYASSITSVYFEDIISPLSTSHWFYNFKNCGEFDLTKLNTSQVTNMSKMFYQAGTGVTSLNIIGLDDFNTSQVTNMSYMFNYTGNNATDFNIGDLSRWDTSQVTNMQHLFNCAGIKATTFNVGNLDNWDTSSVVDMTQMFNKAGENSVTFNIGDLSGWNTENVIGMANMFCNAGKSATWSLDCSSWNVSKATTYYEFNYGVTDKVISPIWVN